MVKGKGEKGGEGTGWEDEVAGQGDGEPQEREGHLSLRALGGFTVLSPCSLEASRLSVPRHPSSWPLPNLITPTSCPLLSHLDPWQTQVWAKSSLVNG